MPEPIKTMECERRRDGKLQRYLRQQRQGPKRRCDTSGVQVPAQKGGNEVAGAEEVEGAGNNNAGETMAHG